MIKIPFWTKDSGNMMNNSTGLSDEQVAFFQSLKPGDRFIMMKNTKKFSERTPEFVLMKYEGVKSVEEEEDSL
jgi:hypothetical protein